MPAPNASELRVAHTMSVEMSAAYPRKEQVIFILRGIAIYDVTEGAFETHALREGRTGNRQDDTFRIERISTYTCSDNREVIEQIVTQYF